MNGREYAAAVLKTLAAALPDVEIDATVQKRLDRLTEAFLTPPDVSIMKLNEEEHMVYGWASVISKDGQQIIDRQGDVVDSADLRGAVVDFMKHQRNAGEMHRPDRLSVGVVVESLVLDDSIQKSLGIDLGMEGWYVGVHVPDQTTWDKVKDGTYKAFSIGGTATREDVPEDQISGMTVVKGYKAINDGTPDGDKSCAPGKKCGKCGKKKCACGVQKFNPNHGADGRFSSGGGGRGAGRGSRSAGASLSGAAGPKKKTRTSGGGAKRRLADAMSRDMARESGVKLPKRLQRVERRKDGPPPLPKGQKMDGRKLNSLVRRMNRLISEESGVPLPKKKMRLKGSSKTTPERKAVDGMKREMSRVSGVPLPKKKVAAKKQKKKAPKVTKPEKYTGANGKKYTYTPGFD